MHAIEPLRLATVMPEHVLVLAPAHGDAERFHRWLGEAGIGHQICPDAAALCAALAQPAGALVVAEESLQGPAGACIRQQVATQPAWSALPVIILAAQTSGPSMSSLGGTERYGRVTFLQRPIRLATLVGTLRLALEDRRRQYRMRDLLAERGAAISMRDELLAMLGHELRNPLAAILLCADVLDAVPPATERARYCRGVIGTSVQQMQRLLDDLSDMSRIHRRKLRLARELIDLRQVLRDAVDQVAEALASRRQHLTLHLDGPPVLLLADPTRLSQVFANLLIHANRCSDAGGRIQIRLATADGLAQVSVRDDGAGLSPEALSRIFEPFCHADSGSPAHLGIGLTLARSLVEMHAGIITAHSAGPGRGSEFVVMLPLEEAAAAGVAKAPAAGADPRPGQPDSPPPAAGPGRHRHILLIEDNADFASGLNDLLEARGHSVDLAHDGTDALRMAQAARPDVVLLGLGLPDMDDGDIAHRLRCIPGLSQVRMVAMTGFGDAADHECLRRAGIERCLVKPVALADLDSAIV